MTEAVRLFLSGPAGSGKTEVARLLETRHGFARVSLGDLCRVECARRGWPADRGHLQAAGDALRARDGAALARQTLADLCGHRGPAVIDGVRLVAEAEYLRRHGFIWVAVVAREHERKARLRDQEGADHMPDHETERQVVSRALHSDIRLVNDSGNRVGAYGLFGHAPVCHSGVGQGTTLMETPRAGEGKANR